VQKRAPAGNGAPQPLHGPADWRTGKAALGSSGGRGGVGGSTGAADPDDGAAETEAGGGAGVPAVAAASAAGATSDCPHDGHTVQAVSSMILRQFWHRLGANGSTWPQNGQARTARSMNLSQYGHGCLKVGIRPLL
jgi:hypothetical protein